MRAFAFAFLLAALAAGGAVQANEDPLKSAACGEAVAALERARTEGQPAEQLRAQAARTCFGQAGPPSRPSRTQQAPVAVPPPVIMPPDPDRGRLALPASPNPPPPPVAVQRAPMPAQCDIAGCWVNDGTHLRHIPPSMAGPRGLCVPMNGLVYCP